MIIDTRIARREWRRIRRARRDEARLFEGRPLDADAVIRRETRGAALWAMLAVWALIFAAAIWRGALA